MYGNLFEKKVLIRRSTRSATHAKLIHRPENKTQLPIVVFVPSDQVSQNSITPAMIMPLIFSVYFFPLIAAFSMESMIWLCVFECVDFHCLTRSSSSFKWLFYSEFVVVTLFLPSFMCSLWYTSIIIFTFLFRRWHFNTAIKTIHSPEINLK